MCTEFERSTYWILQLLDDKHPKSEREIDNTLEEEHPEMLLGAGNSLQDVLDSLCSVNELAKREEGYVLTPVGMRVRDSLRKAVENDLEESPIRASA